MDDIAALLHDEWCVHFDPAEWSIPPVPMCQERANRLRAAGVALAAPAEGLVEDRHNHWTPEPRPDCPQCTPAPAEGLDLDGKPFCPTGSAQRYHAIGECFCEPPAPAEGLRDALLRIAGNPELTIEKAQDIARAALTEEADHAE